VIKKQSIRHKVAGVKDDRRQHVEEESVGGERRDMDSRRKVEHESDANAYDNQQTGFGKDSVQFRRHVKTWEPKKRRLGAGIEKGPGCPSGWSNKPDVVGSIPVTTELFLISCDSNQVPKWFGTH